MTKPDTDDSPDELERSLAIDAVLASAAEIGIEAALERYGSILSGTETNLLLSVTPEELSALQGVQSKLPQAVRRPTNNNNNNNTKPK
jgi:hypothetical protein